MFLKQIVRGTYPHKWTAIFDNNGRENRVNFGHQNYEDYTQLDNNGKENIERRTAYRKRHEKDLLTNTPTRAGFLSYYILWGNSTSLNENIKSYKHKFNL